MHYQFNIGKEAIWFIAVTVIVAVALHFVQFQPSEIDDWATWAVGIGAAAVRALAGAVIAVLTRPQDEWPDPGEGASHE